MSTREFVKELDNFGKARHKAIVARIEERIIFFLEQMASEPYVFNRSETEVRDYLWTVSGWKKSKQFPYGITHEEYISMWEGLRKAYTIREFISERRAMAFYKDLKGKLYDGNTTHADTCTLSVHQAAELLKADEETVDTFFVALKVHRITERQGNGLVF